MVTASPPTGVTGVAALRPLQRGDRDRVTAFMLRVYPGLAREPEFAARYYEWKYFDVEGRDTGLPTGFVAEDAEGMAGFIGCLPFRLRRGESRSPAAWIADWHLLPRARGRGVGRALLRTAMDAIPMLACVNGSEDAERIYAAEGFLRWDAGRSWLRVRRPIVYEWPHRRGPRKALGLLRSAQWAMYALGATTFTRTSRLLSGDIVGADAEPEALRVCRDARYDGMVRDGGYLRWLERSPAAAVTRILLRSGERAVGHALVQDDVDGLGRRRRRILDVLLEDERMEWVTSAYVIAAGWPRPKGEGKGEGEADYIDCVVPARHDAALRAAGFRRRGIDRLWIHGKELRYESGERWLLSLADKDDAFRGSGVVP